MLYSDFEHCVDGCGIYLVKNLINGKVYIGQTVRLFTARWLEHINVSKYPDSVNSNLLSKAIAKYGIANFDFCVLELCSKEDLDKREQFWIATFKADSHDNYNQTAGGQNANLQINPSGQVLNIIDLLQTSNLSIKAIAEKCSCAIGVVYDINSGARHYNKNLIYPIRNLQQSRAVLLNMVVDDICNTELSFAKIASKNNVSLSYVKRANNGTANMKLANKSYPLRKYEQYSQDYVMALISDLINTTISFTELEQKYNISKALLYGINNGTLKHNSSLTYPLRNTRRMKNTAVQDVK